MSGESIFDIAALSDVGTEREHNEDACGTYLEGAKLAVAAVADGVSGFAGGQEASRRAVDVTLQSFREQPRDVSAAKRLVQAVQQANIEVHDRALIVTELRGMSTTLTAIALDGGELFAAHVGDSRLYRVRDGQITQLTKDHTVTAERVRMGVLSEEKARRHPERSTLTRSLGRDLIAAIDRISTRLAQGDALLVCSDGLYNVLDAEEIVRIVGSGDAKTASRALIDTANERGTLDNLTAIVVRVTGPVPPPRRPSGIFARIKGLVGGT